MIKHLISPQRISRSFLVVGFFFFQFSEIQYHMLSSWTEKPFVISVSKCLFPFWSPSSLRCCQRWEAIVSVALVSHPPLSSLHPSLPLASQLWQEVLGWKVMGGAVRHVSFWLCSWLFITQEKAESQRQASWVLSPFCRPLPVLWNRGQVTQSLEKLSQFSIPCFLPSFLQQHISTLLNIWVQCFHLLFLHLS